MSAKIYLAKSFRDLSHELQKEIEISGGKIIKTYEDLFIYEGFDTRPLWAQFYGEDPKIEKFESISDGANILLKHKKRWCSISITEHRRAELIQEKVFRYKIPKLDFLKTPPAHDWGFWSLIQKNELLYCEHVDAHVPLGEIVFNESDEPPSRAYLKLWEVMTIHGVQPRPQQNVVDLGACPGGWTWVLAELGCTVSAVDKAPLDPKILDYKNVRYFKKDAFKIGVDDLGMPEWIFSDVICYPKDLLELVQKWMEIGVKNFVCTLKFKGETDWTTIREFQKIEGGRLVHLCANKHELTFIRNPMS